MKILNNLNLSLFELQNARIHNLASEPTGYAGLSYYNTATFKVGIFSNSTWKYFLTEDLLGAVSGIATLNASSKVVQDPASAYTLSGGTTGRIPLSSTGGRLDVSYIPTLNNIPAPTASVAMNSQAITGLLDPTNAQDAATKNYVDNAVQGLDAKASVRCASIGVNITLSGTQTIDGIALIAGDRVLLKDQTAPAENGVYIVAAGAWARASDANSWGELVSAFVFVESGATNADAGYVCTADQGGTLDTTANAWTQFSGAGTISGANVGTGTGAIFRDKTGSTLNFKKLLAGSTKVTITNGADDVTLDVNEANLSFANMTNSGTLAVAKGGTGSANVGGAKTNLGFMTRFAADIGNGVLSSIPVTHSLNTLDVEPVCYLKSTGEKVYPDMFVTDVNTCTFVFGAPPTANQYRVVIIG